MCNINKKKYKTDLCRIVICHCLEGVHFNSLNICQLATVHIVKTYCYLIMYMYLDTSSGKFYTLSPWSIPVLVKSKINIKQLDKEFTISFLVKCSRDEDFNDLFNF